MRTLLLTLALPALALFAACGDDDDGEGATPSPDASPTASAAVTQTAAPDVGASPTIDPLTIVCGENPDIATDEVVQVDAPVAGDAVSSPVSVRGRVAAFEAVFQITIFDADENIIAEATGMSSEGQTLAPFEEEVEFSVSEETVACLWVYERSARDNSPIHVYQIPVRLLP